MDTIKAAVSGTSQQCGMTDEELKACPNGEGAPQARQALLDPLLLDLIHCFYWCSVSFHAVCVVNLFRSLRSMPVAPVFKKAYWSLVVGGALYFGLLFLLLNGWVQRQ